MRTHTLITSVILCFLLVSVKGIKVGHAWKDYSPQCDQECNKVGEPCDIGKEIICCMAGQCTSKFGLSVCDAPLISFTCNPIPQDDLIK